MTVQGIIKRAVKRLELEGKILTPDAYAESFCKEAKKTGIVVEDCSHVENLSKTLNKEFKKELTAFRIKSMNELSRFLIARLNRTNPDTCSKLVESQSIFLKRVLQVVEVLHNKEASELARKSLDLLVHSPTSSQLDQSRHQWIDFLTTYDNSFLQKIGKKSNLDLKQSIDDLDMSFKSSSLAKNNMNLRKIASLLVLSFVPSIASSVNEKIATLSDKIRNKPSLLDSVSIENEIKTTISLRIALDKESVKEMVESLDGVLDKLSLHLIDMIEISDASTLDIQTIKLDLENYKNGSELNFKTAHQKLLSIATSLEKNTKVLSKDLKGHSTEVAQLGQKIKKLEKELAESKKESKEDFLTKLYNKRALDEFMATKEAEFKRYEHNYTIVMFDIDFFKLVNDDYGHDAGDVILFAFAKILKQECRNVDIVGRFGGEEFLALLSDTNSEGGFKFAEKVREHVQKARFMSKGKRIKVTVSGGVSDRSKNLSLTTTLKSADNLLYEAKNSGRNKIVYKR